MRNQGACATTILTPLFLHPCQVVALHSKGVLKTEDGRRNPSRLLTTMAGRVTDLQWDANLGVRISFIVDSIRRTPVAVSNQLLADFLSDVQRGGSPIQPGAAAPVAVAKTPLLLHRTVAQTDGSEEAGRALATGYDPGFLDVKVQLPQIGPKAKAFGSPLVVPGTRECLVCWRTPSAQLLSGIYLSRWMLTDTYLAMQFSKVQRLSAGLSIHPHCPMHALLQAALSSNTHISQSS
eukprot:GHRR01003123.1.p1 GENE.GHRR01003123.1~~GHRR01003123.1.p1  ORF type:complete len:236 (+),score=49.21 GHRR01003123.1:1108-1815(+)